MGQHGRFFGLRSSSVFNGLGVMIGLLTCGCGQPRYPNSAAQCENKVPPACTSSYRFDNLALGPGNTDELFICLTFSGGGTRAAALAYGVLQELHDTAIPSASDGYTRSLLNEVDVVSSVSGGSFTALALKHWGNELFSGPFAERFLYHNVTADLVVRVIVRNLFVLPLIFPDRIHIAADYVNEEIFDHSTFAGFRKQRPFVVVNATSMTGHRFEFTQDDFDLLGSDLDTVPLGHAAMASSAYPLLLSPMRLRYYQDELSSWAIQKQLTNDHASLESPRRSEWARGIVNRQSRDYALDVENHRFVYLLDGGVQDNLGMDYVLEAYRSGPIRERLHTPEQAKRIRRLVVIAVNAATEMPDGVEQRRIAPGLLEMGSRSASIAVNSHSDRTLELARSLFDKNGQGEDGLEYYLIEVNPRNVDDAERRKMLLSLPTRFDLRDSEVNAVIAAGRELLRNHSGFIKLRESLNNGPNSSTQPVDHSVISGPLGGPK